jgi:4-hydroxybenzoate polyprenyltransferase
LLTVLAIIVYNRWHKGFGFAPWVMGACRMGVVAIAALLVNPTPPDGVWAAAFSIGAYVVGLTHVASFETKERVGRRFIAWLTFVPALVIGVDLMQASFTPRVGLTLVALLIQVSWAAHLIRGVKLGTPNAIPKAVTGLIAGLSLVDAAFVARAEPLPWVLVCWAFFGLTLILQRKIAGT